jgi:hypothetical protein
MKNQLTITVPYYDNPEMLQEQLKVWKIYPQDVNIVVVDDGSWMFPALEVLQLAKLQNLLLYKIIQDIPWNHGGARNLAMAEIHEGWVVLTDVDHIMPVSSVERLQKMTLDKTYVYYPRRYKAIQDHVVDHHQHRDSFILHRDLFWEVGGFDERFSGYWNGVSRLFRTALKNKAKMNIALPDVSLILHEPDNIPDASTKLGRKGSVYDINSNPTLKKEFNRALKKYEPKNHLQFKWIKQL